MTDMLVSGAGTSAYNGTYAQIADYDGYPSYQLDASHFIWYNTSFEAWIISASQGDETSGYYKWGTTLIGAFDLSFNVSDPPPTVSEATPPSGTNQWINVDDTWRQLSEAWVNVDDAWRKVTEAWVNVDDTWRKLYSV